MSKFLKCLKYLNPGFRKYPVIFGQKMEVSGHIGGGAYPFYTCDSMTQLLSHTFAHLTGSSFRLKAKLLPIKNILGVKYNWVNSVKKWPSYYKIKCFKNCSCQKMSITEKLLLNWYFSMKKKIRKIRTIFDVENWLWKSEFCNFQQLLRKFTQDLKKFFWQ